MPGFFAQCYVLIIISAVVGQWFSSFSLLYISHYHKLCIIVLYWMLFEDVYRLFLNLAIWQCATMNFHFPKICFL